VRYGAPTCFKNCWERGGFRIHLEKRSQRRGGGKEIVPLRQEREEAIDQTAFSKSPFKKEGRENFETTEKCYAGEARGRGQEKETASSPALLFLKEKSPRRRTRKTRRTSGAIAGTILGRSWWLARKEKGGKKRERTTQGE